MWQQGMRSVGFSNFQDRAEVKEVLSRFTRPDLSLAVGVMASQHSLANKPINRWPGRFPKREAIRPIFSDHPQTANIVHYVSGERKDLDGQLENVKRWSGKHLDGIQLDIAWPDVHAMRSFKGRWPDIKFILQVGTRAMSMMKDDDRQIVLRVQQEYGRVIDCVLFDGSCGNGRPFDPAVMIRRIELLRELGYGKGIAIAGGLGPKTLGLLKPINERCKGISIDAEGALHDHADGPVNWDSVYEYVERAQVELQ